jgi:PEP-CTERM motif
MRISGISRFSRIMAGVILLGLASAANAIPTLTFGGNLSYTASSGLLTLNGQLLSSQSLFPAIDFASSTIALSTTFSSSTSMNGVTSGSFNAGTLSISDSSGGLLSGAFSLAQLAGLNGSNQGALSLFFTPTGGSLSSYFSNPSDLFALTLNLSMPFGTNMYSSNFTGIGNGNITSRTAVPEPGVISLLAAGLGLLGISGWHRRNFGITNG